MPGVKDWLKKASSDLKASKKLSDDHETLDCSAFHTHQYGYDSRYPNNHFKIDKQEIEIAIHMAEKILTTIKNTITS